MFFPRRFTPARLVLAALLLLPLLAGATNFPHESSDLPVDPAIKWGRLDNGLRYVIQANPEPKGRISARLAVHVGSLFENENQRGLAHFL